MSVLRILRNLAVLVILTVGGLALTPRVAGAFLACPSVPCSARTACQPCGFGGCRCPFPHHGIALKCYDTLLHRSCFTRCICT